MSDVQAGSWIMVALAVVAMIKSSLDSRNARLSTKDQLDADKTMALLKVQHDTCMENTKNLKEQLESNTAMYVKAQKDLSEILEDITYIKQLLSNKPNPPGSGTKLKK